MDYVVRLKWGGLHGDISLSYPKGDPLYVVQVGALDIRHKWDVIGADGHPLYDIQNSGGGLGTKYRIHQQNRLLGEVGSGLWWSQGHIHLKNAPPIQCRYGWGLKRKLPLQQEGDEQVIGELELQGGLSAQGKLHIAHGDFDMPAFQIACMLIFRDWASR